MEGGPYVTWQGLGESVFRSHRLPLQQLKHLVGAIVNSLLAHEALGMGPSPNSRPLKESCC